MIVEFLKIGMRKSFDKCENLCYYFKDRAAECISSAIAADACKEAGGERSAGRFCHR